jgi:hypothetical protein
VQDNAVSNELSPTPADGITARLAGLEGLLRDELGDRATVHRQLLDGGRISALEITPTNPDSLRLTWLKMVNELMFQAGHNGGRWELDRTQADVAFIESLARSVIAGRAVETYGPGRSHVAVTLADGSVKSETGYDGCLPALIPLPGWKHWGRKVHYEPYR